jgi:hypothetical protein
VVGEKEVLFEMLVAVWIVDVGVDDAVGVEESGDGRGSIPPDFDERNSFLRRRFPSMLV